MTAGVVENMSLLSGAPSGIKRLRQLIQTLAIQGRLVPQDHTEEAAPVLFKRIASHKADAAARGRARRAVEVDVPPELADAPVAPAGWLWTTLGGVTVCRDGERVPVSQVDRERRQKVYDYYGASGVIDKIDGYLFDKPLLLIGEDGANLINRSSPIAFIARGQYWVNNHAHVIDGLTEGLLQYLELYINAIDLKPYVTGTAQPKMNQAKLNAIPLALPPEAEQARIVAKVDELMALCDRLEAEQADAEAAHATLVQALLASLTQARDAADFHASWQQLSEHFHTLFTTEASIDALKSAVLRLAVMGRLAPQRPAETVDGLDTLSTVVAWRQQAVLRKEIREPRKPMEAIEDDEHPFVRPEGWKWIRLGTLIYIQSGDGLTAANMQPGDVPVFGGNGVNGHHDSCNVLSPTLVIGRVGYYCGSVHITPEKAWVTDNAFITKFCNEATDIRFLYWLLKCTNLKENDSATAQPVISGAKINPIVVGLPPLAEQRRIVSKIDECITFCDQLKLRLIQASQQHEHLASVLVEQATV